MMCPMLRTIVAVLATLLLLANVADAQTNWPSRPVKILVPTAPGGTADALAVGLCSFRSGGNQEVGRGRRGRQNPADRNSALSFTVEIRHRNTTRDKDDAGVVGHHQIAGIDPHFADLDFAVDLDRLEPPLAG